MVEANIFHLFSTFYFILSYLIDYSIQSEILSLYLHDSYGACGISIQIGKMNPVEVYEVDLIRNFSWTSYELNFPRSKANLLRSEFVWIEGGSKDKANLYELELRLSDLKSATKSQDDPEYIDTYDFPDFPMYYIESLFLYNYDSISFAYSFQNESFSVLHQLYKNKIIPHKSFAIQLDDPFTSSGIMYIGGIPKQLLSNYSYSSQCFVNKTINQWSCELTSIELNGEVYNNVIYPSFQTNTIRILSPKGFMDYVEKVYFRDLIKDSKCLKVERYEADEIQCSCEDIPENFTMHFEINGNIFTLNRTELFEKVRSTCTFMIQENYLDDKQWVFGSIFFYKYLTYFNTETSSITFYSLTPFKKSISFTTILNKSIFLVIIVTLCIWITILLFFNNKK